MSWVECVVDSDYEIYTDFPYYIRKKSNKHIISENIHSTGYVRTTLHREKYLKHRIVALQFIPNPNNFPEVDHINHDRSDYHIENLRWVSSSQNKQNQGQMRNKLFEYFDEIPADEDDIIEVRDYGEHEFEDLYFADDYFYYYNGLNYKRLHINYNQRGSAYVEVKDTEKRRVHILLSSFKRLYGLN